VNAEGRCICTRFVTVSEAGALGAAEWIGRAMGSLESWRRARPWPVRLRDAGESQHSRQPRERPGGGRAPGGGRTGGRPVDWAGAADEAKETVGEVPVWDAVVQPLEAINALAREPKGHWR